MTAEHIERVFGRGRLKMATGEHVEVFREAVAAGERRRYTKRFLATDEADFGLWTEREWRILARLIGHGIVCVPDVVQFDGGASGGMRRVQTYDAGVTVDQWATLLPVSRAGTERHSIFEDCAHWWALAHHCLAALNEIHALQLVHLDVKGDNICVPYGPAHFDPNATGSMLYPMFARLALIDFAFSLVSGERLGTALPIGWQKDYDYQSPRLLSALEAGRRGDLRPTQELDWRCDLYSLAAMLKRYLPNDEWAAAAEGREAGWTATRYDDARSLIYHLRECHDHALPDALPHQELMDVTGARTRERDLAESLVTGWTLARDAVIVDASTPITPLTRIAPVDRTARPGSLPLPLVPPTAPTAVIRRPRVPASAAVPPTRIAPPAVSKAPRWRATALASTIVAVCALAAPSFVGDPSHSIAERTRDALAALRPPESRNAEPTARSDSADPSAQPADTVRKKAESSAANAPAAASSNESAAASTPPAGSPSDTATTSDKPAAASPAAATPSQPPVATPEPVTAPAPAPTVADSRPPRTSQPASVPIRASRSHAAAPSVASKPAPATRSVASKGSNRATTPRTVTASPAMPSASMIASNGAPGHDANSSTRHAQAADSRVAANESRPSPTVHESVANPAGTDVPATITGAASVPAPPPVDANSPAVAAAPRAGASVDVAKSPVGAGGASASSDGVRRSSSSQASRGGWLGELWKQLTVLRQAPAPVEERSGGAPRSVAKAPRRTGEVATAEHASSSARPAEIPRSVPIETAQASASQVVIAPLVAKTAPAGELLVPPTGAPSSAVAASPPVEFRAANAAVSTPNANQRAARPPGVEVRASEATDDELAARGKRFSIEAVPYVATQAYADASRALSIAYRARDSSQDPAIVDAVFATWPSESARVPATTIAPLRARRLHEEARKAIAYGGDVASAMEIELKAFGANPRDSDIAQFLAVLHLWTKPAQPEMARQLALFAIALSGPKRTSRTDYWNTFAVASALSRRENDATAAFLVETALSTSLDRSCRAALHAYASYGDPLRAPVQAMLYRVRSQPRAYAYPSCAWPQL